MEANSWANIIPMVCQLLANILNPMLFQPLHVHRGNDGPTIGIQDWANADPMLNHPLASNIVPMQIQRMPNQSMDWLPWLDERWIYIGPTMEANRWANINPMVCQLLATMVNPMQFQPLHVYWAMMVLPLASKTGPMQIQC